MRLTGLENSFPKITKGPHTFPNALDFATDQERKTRDEQSNIVGLENLGLEVEHIDLRNYFGQQDELEAKINEFGAIWVSGGSAFILRQAMKLSGFDTIIKDLSKQDDVVYGGYNDGVCVLGPTLKGLELYGLEAAVLSNDPNFRRYGYFETVWEGLGLLDYSIVPHYKSEHPESKDSDRVIGYMITNKMLFKALSDGEVIIIQ